MAESRGPAKPGMGALYDPPTRYVLVNMDSFRRICLSSSPCCIHGSGKYMSQLQAEHKDTFGLLNAHMKRVKT